MSDKITSLGFTFDANTVAPAAAMQAVPSGWYSVAIADAEVTLNDGGNGRRLAIEFTILEGQYKGRKIFDGFNIVHSNAQAQKIAQEQFSTICHATGVYQVADVSQLVNKTLQIKVDVEGERWVDADKNKVDANTPGATRYEPKNRFKGAKSGSAPQPAATGAPAGAAPAWAVAAKPGAAPTGAPPPWAVQGSQGGSVAPAAAPAAAPAGKPKPASKPKPAAKPATAAPKVERKFYVGIDGPAFSEPLTESKLVEYFAQGMPANTPICLDGEDTYKTAAEYGVGAAPAPAAVTPPPAAVVPPAASLPPWATK